MKAIKNIAVILTTHPLVTQPRLSLLPDSDVRVGRGARVRSHYHVERTDFVLKQLRSYHTVHPSAMLMMEMAPATAMGRTHHDALKGCRWTAFRMHRKSCSPPAIILPPPTHTQYVMIPERKNLLFKYSKTFQELSTCQSGWEISIIITVCSQGLRPQMTCLCPEWIPADS